MMGATMKFIGILITLVLLGGCGLEGCDDWVAPGISISIYDAETKDPLCEVSAVITGEDHYEETVSFDSNCEHSYITGADEKTGVFKVVLSKDGYITKEIENIEVFQLNQCHVDSTEIDVYLERDS